MDHERVIFCSKNHTTPSFMSFSALIILHSQSEEKCYNMHTEIILNFSNLVQVSVRLWNSPKGPADTAH
jgi:hypothetical protein